MTWRPIEANLREALGEINHLAAILHYMAFKELPEYCRMEGAAEWMEKQCAGRPFDTGRLFVGLEHAYHHLNWAVNCRNEKEENVWHFSDDDAERWGKFPTDVAFKMLWPSPSRCKGKPREALGDVRLFCISPVRAEIEMAQRKLNNLHRLANEGTLAEEDFLKCARSVYIHLNSAWNSRNDDWGGDFKSTKVGIRRRMTFPRAFAMGCYNMWPER